MHVEEEIPPTVPKDTIGDHKTYIVRKKHKRYRSFLCPLPQQRYQHLSYATADLLSFPSVTANLQTLCN